jgi:hypothetical protein
MVHSERLLCLGLKKFRSLPTLSVALKESDFEDLQRQSSVRRTKRELRADSPFEWPVELIYGFQRSLAGRTMM